MSPALPPGSRPFMLSLRTLVMVAGLSALAGACALSTPFPRIDRAVAGEADDTVVLVLTHIIVDGARRDEFDRQTRRVIDSMSTQPGLIGYSARRELFGNEAWTMSVWASDAARARFVRSAVHQEAIAKSESAIVTVRLKRLNMARKDVPRDWAAALELLARPGNERVYKKD
ncbi:antibiotic biosynthesis monooxygenase family protein [Methyloversatilis sp. RAC08]|uniref:antibiotic biosynthesis monooxygenase family protein n=1 Tax=Methyloversatilis sp. RAC08 TaxID=1842540 RepID=UPI0008568669|nr:antibiotic biosynthesis monooxygenase family protein [Methyloversatilis sp. RAC08]AOF82336.1 antibiotic biosynthesis monooxygenase family protein [Methyloversatilis sp. RAC08]